MTYLSNKLNARLTEEEGDINNQILDKDGNLRVGVKVRFLAKYTLKEGDMIDEIFPIMIHKKEEPVDIV